MEKDEFGGTLVERDSFGGTLVGAGPAQSAGGTLPDLGKSVKVGVQKLPGMLTGLADLPFALAAGARPVTNAADALGEATGFTPGKWADETKFSKGYEDGRAAVDAAWKDGSAADIAGAYLTNPGYTANQVAESLPSMVAGGVASKALMGVGRVAGMAADAVAGTAARAATPGLLARTVGEKWAVPVAAGAGEGAVTAGQQMAEYQGDDQQKNALASLGASVGTGLIGGVSGRVANKFGLETAETAMARMGSRAGGAGTDVPPSLKRRVLGGMVSEAVLQELPQSAQEQMWNNFANGKPVMEGVDRAGVEGALAGGVMGAGANLRGPGAQPANNAQPAADPAVDAPPSPVPQLGYSPLAGTPTVFPDGSVALGSEAELAHRYAPQPVKPSEEMGINPAAGPLSAAAASAVDSGIYMPPADQAAPAAPEPDPVVLQNRDRTSAASIAQMQDIAANPDYLRVGPSRDMTSGAPVVFGELPPTALLGRPETVVDGKGERMGTQYAVVDAGDLIASNNADGTTVGEYATGAPGKLRSVAGNGRTAGLQAAYQMGTADNYRQELSSDAAALGIEPKDIAAMQRPVLVRVMQNADVTNDMGDRTNITATQKLSPLEQAGNDARRLDVRTLAFDEGGSPTLDSLKGFVSAMPVAERGDMLNADGTPTRQAVDRLMAATFKQAYDSDELVQLYAQATDPDARAVMAAAADASGVMANLKGTGEFDVRAAVADAAKMAVNAARQGLKLSDVMQNADIDMNPEAFPVAAFMAENIRTPRKMAEGLRRWGQLALEQARIADENTRQGGMFGAAPTLSRQAIFARLGDGANPTAQGIAPAAPAAVQPAPEQAALMPAPQSPQSPQTNPNGEPNGTQADQAQQATPQQPAQVAQAAQAPVERHPNWRKNAIQAGRVARSLGIDPTGKRLAQMVADIDAHDLRRNQAVEPANTALTAINKVADNVQKTHQPQQDAAVAPVKPAKPAKKPSAKKKQEHEAKLAAHTDYFTPGNVVANGMGGHNKVVSYTPPDADGHWSAVVQPVEQQGGAWANVPGTKERQHSTEPTARELKAGPVQRAPDATENVAASAQPEGVTGQNDDESTAAYSDATKPKADRQLKETERAYGGRVAYDRARAADKTRLTYGQWVQVRTPKFKAWFGDWQAVLAQQRLDSMEPVKVRVPEEWRGMGHAELRQKMAEELDRMVREKVEIEHPELGTIRVGRTGAKKSEGSARDPAKSLVAADIESLIPASIYARSDASRGGDGPDIAGYSTLLARVQVDGVDLVASFTVRHQSDGQWYYNAVALHDAKEKAQDSYGRPDQQAGSRVAPIAGLSDFVRRSLARVNPDAVSKVVDQNTGEPLVVYHGTNADFNAFRVSEGMYGTGVYLAKLPEYASGFADSDGANVMPVFANIRGDMDGNILPEKRGGIFVAFSPEQVKSAIGNSGDFDGANPDIRFSRAAPKPQDFVPNADGGLDYGEITPEMGKAMRRQAGKIRLQQGVQNADGTGWGLAHIEARHGKEIRAAGFDSAENFVADAFENMGEIWKPGVTTQLIAVQSGRTGKVAFIQLEADSKGGTDFYRVNSAFPANEKYVARKEKKEGWVQLWSRYPVPADASGASGFVGQSPKAGETTPTVSDQSGSASVAPKDSAANYARADAGMSPDLARAILALGQPAQSATKESVRAAVRELVNGGGLLPNRLGRVVVATAAEIKEHWEPLIGPVAMESEGAGRAQGFYDPKTKTVFLIADHIQAGDELGVVAHELMHKHGPAVLGEQGWSQLHGAIEGWATAAEDSMERKVYDEAARRVQASGPELSSQELFPYAVQVALEMGVRPNAIAPKGSIERWLGQVRAALRQVWSKIATHKSDFKSLDLVNLAFAIAQRENPATGTSLDAQGATMQDAEASSFSRSAAGDQTQTEAFKKWFAGSKVVDANDQPRVMYHGTAADFTTFSPSKATDKDGRKMGMGWGKGKFYFAATGDAASSAAQFAEMTKRGKQQNVMPVYLSVQSPVSADEYMDMMQAAQDTGMSRDQAIAAADKQLKARGIDGIIDDMTGAIAVFLPTQIKSAIGNNGDFDGANPDIRFSRATSSVPESAAEWLSDTVIADEVENRISSFAHQPPIRIRDTAFGQLPGVARNDNVAGAVHDGAIYLFRDQLGNREAVQRTLFHELLHYGLRKLLTKAQFTSQMLNLYHRDKAIKDEADRWAATADGVRAKAQGGSDYALARGVDEALAVLAEPNGGAYLNQTARSMFVRRVTRWLADVAQFLGMDKAAAYLRSIKNEEAREYIQSVFSKLASEATGKTADWSDTSEPAFSRAAPAQPTAIQSSMGELTPEQASAYQRVAGTKKVPTLKERFAVLKANFGLKARQALVDQFAAIKQLDQHAYMQARMSKASDGTLEAALLYGKPFMNGGVPDVKIGSGGFAKVLASLDGEHDRLLMWMAALRADRLKAEGKENLFTDDDISALKTLNAGKMKDGRSRPQVYAKALGEINAFNEAMLKIGMESGLIDQAAYDIMKDQPYVPFYRLMEDDGVQGPRFSSGLTGQQAFKKLKGGSQQLNADLLENMLLSWSSMLQASAKNRAALATMDAAEKMAVAYKVPATTHGKATKGAVKVMRDGITEHWMVEDPYLLEAIGALHYTVSPLMKPLTKMKQVLTMAVTVNPTFKIRNLIRDSISAIAQSELGYNPAANVKNAWKLTAKDSQIYASMLAGGGIIKFGTQKNTDRLRAQVAKLGGNVLDKTGTQKLMGQVGELWEVYSEFGDRTENVNRAALYDQLIKKGKSHAEASFMARDLMDFSMGGGMPLVRFLTQTVPFLNARLVGLDKLGRAAMDDPRKFATMAAAVSIASVALMMLHADDDDWKEREDWDRDAYWWLKIGSFAFKIPKPFELGAIGTMAERTAELMFSKEMTNKRFAERMAHMFSQTFAFDPVPQAIKPLWDVYSNKDSFTKRAIESQADQRLRPEDRYNERTSEVARLLGQLGLPEPSQLIKGDYVGLSPKQIDHLIRGYFSWVGVTATTAADMLVRPALDRGERPALRLKDTFMVGNFVESLPTGSSRYVSQMYEQSHQVQQAYASYREAIKLGDMDKARSIQAADGDILRSRIGYDHATQQMSKIGQQAKKVEADRSMSAADKRERLDALEQRRGAIAKRAVERAGA